MDILHICPAGIATGGTDGIHHLVSELNKCGANAKILYVNGDLKNPRPKEYEHYNCDYVTELPKDFDGYVIFPEIWANQILEPQYKNCKVMVNWQGVDVYNWHNPESERGKFLQRTDALHLTVMEYGRDYLERLNLKPIKVPDCVDDYFFEHLDYATERKDLVLYNPVGVKLTEFQERVMARCTSELGIKFKPIEGYTKQEVKDLFYHSKLYIDFGVFSGRERLPREAVLCGCCIITSNRGAASYYLDNPIPDEYKISDIDLAIKKIDYVLKNYDTCVINDFAEYRFLLNQDRFEYHRAVAHLYKVMEDNYG